MCRSHLIVLFTLLLKSEAKHTVRVANTDHSSASVDNFNAESSPDTIQSLESLWVKPSWWSRYRLKLTESNLKKCMFLDGEAPMNGSPCPIQPSDYMCMFGEQECCDANGQLKTHPETRCTCASDSPTWLCSDVDDVCSPCPIIIASTCPKEMPTTGLDMCSGVLDCVYGKLECCGQVTDDITCKCIDNGVFHCEGNPFQCDYSCSKSSGALLAMSVRDLQQNLPSCPTAMPVAGESCDGADLSCDFGVDECCGVTYPEKKCICSGGSWQCLFLDACMIKNC